MIIKDNQEFITHLSENKTIKSYCNDENTNQKGIASCKLQNTIPN